MIELKMPQKFFRMSPRRQKKHINQMTRKMIHLALLNVGYDTGPLNLDTKRSDVKIATATIVGKTVQLKFFDEDQ